MAPVARRLFDIDDDEVLDDDGNGPYDKRYPGQRVIADRGRVRVPVQLTDGMPPEYRAAMSHRVADGFAHRPHYIEARDSVELRDAERAAARAYDARSAYLENAWRGPATPMLPLLRDGEDARADWIRRQGEAWKSPPSCLPKGNPFETRARLPLSGDVPDTIQAVTARKQFLGARPGEEGEAIAAARKRQGGATTRGTYYQSTANASDAAADADATYREYVARISDGWRR